MSVGTENLVSLYEAQQGLDSEFGGRVNYSLARFLLLERGIPVVRTGRSTTRWLTPESVDMLREAVREFLAKAEGS